MMRSIRDDWRAEVVARLAQEGPAAARALVIRRVAELDALWSSGGAGEPGAIEALLDVVEVLDAPISSAFFEMSVSTSADRARAILSDAEALQTLSRPVTLTEWFWLIVGDDTAPPFHQTLREFLVEMTKLRRSTPVLDQLYKFLVHLTKTTPRLATLHHLAAWIDAWIDAHPLDPATSTTRTPLTTLTAHAALTHDLAAWYDAGLDALSTDHPDPTTAHAAFTHALAIRPTLAEAWHQLAWLHHIHPTLGADPPLGADPLARATALYTAQLTADPQDPHPRFWLATLLALDPQRHDEAVTHLLTTLAIEPAYADEIPHADELRLIPDLPRRLGLPNA